MLLLILLQFIDLRGHNIAPEVASQLLGNCVGLERYCGSLIPPSCWVSLTLCWSLQLGRQKQKINKLKPRETGNMWNAGPKQWIKAVPCSELRGPESHLCPVHRTSSSTGSFSALAFWGLTSSVSQMISSPWVSRVEKNKFWSLGACMSHQALRCSPAYEARQLIWPLRVCFLSWKAWRVASTVFHQI